MRKQPIVEQVDVVIGEEGEERLVTVAKTIADRWPDIYRRTETAKGNKTAAARRAKDARGKESAPITDAADLPAAGDTTTATAAAVTTAGTSGVTTEGVTS
ncbi:hypothetical protein [Curtobacterium sp. MCBD17_030]|uniref:hypothetical protein n=1 Tax=Curtobacterium sp. MCBD17_030 TaxID=2175649 RepID=UPI000D9AB27A|nr:hypothetical protein [Curtobacterium sp. MCBD17_030]PYY32355.1 hypothetical protein DEI89_13045 [Curtobacterium sp. MCBD17_030]